MAKFRHHFQKLPLLLIFFSFAFSGCFEIIEDVQLKSDGSGSFQYIVNFSQSSTKIKSLMLMSEVEGYKVPTESKIDREFQRMAYISGQVNGISHVQAETDLDKFIFKYSCNFQKIENLNTLIDTVKKQSQELESKSVPSFEFKASEKKFIRHGDNSLKEKYDALPESQKMIFEGAEYTCLYRFESEIDSIFNPAAIMSKNRKVSFFKILMPKLASNGNKIKQIIQLR